MGPRHDSSADGSATGVHSEPTARSYHLPHGSRRQFRPGRLQPPDRTLPVDLREDETVGRPRFQAEFVQATVVLVQTLPRENARIRADLVPVEAPGENGRPVGRLRRRGDLRGVSGRRLPHDRVLIGVRFRRRLPRDRAPALGEFLVVRGREGRGTVDEPLQIVTYDACPRRWSPLCPFTLLACRPQAIPNTRLMPDMTTGKRDCKSGREAAHA
jgi:hypothetical protein